TRRAAAGIAVIDAAIAVVVGAVADLGRRPDPADAHTPHAGGAHLLAGPAGADAAAARLAHTRHPARAVGVSVVARLGRRPRRADTRAPDASAARLRAGDAFADVGAAAAREPVVDDAVAIVVEVVADLSGRNAAAAHALIDDAVAVVVDAIARLG